MRKVKITKEDIINNLKSEEIYIKEIKELNDELGIALLTGTLIKGEAEDLILKMFEKISDDVIATVEYEDGNRKTIAMHTLDGKWMFPNELIKQKVIAWMPLPDPYREEAL